jgi:hypothetical protein
MPETGIRKSLLPDDFVSLLAEHNHSTVDDIYAMFSRCAQCHQNAVYPILAVEGESWVGNTDLGSLKLVVYGLCERCVAVPDVIQIINRKVFEQLRTSK